MSRARILLPRRKINSAIIEAFHCSQCAWECVMQQQQPGIICYDEVDRAAQKFDRHRCELYAPGEAGRPLTLAGDAAPPRPRPEACRARPDAQGSSVTVAG